MSRSRQQAPASDGEERPGTNKGSARYVKMGGWRTTPRKLLDGYTGVLTTVRRASIRRRALISILIGLLFCLAVDTALLRNIWLDAPETTLTDVYRPQLFKALLNLALVGIIGAGIASFFKYMEEVRAETRRHAEVRYQFLSRLGAAYRSAKEARRLLRAGGLKPGAYRTEDTLSENEIETYDKTFDMINKAQLDLEALTIASQYLPEVQSSGSIKNDLREMEDYLNAVVSEYEEFRPGDELRLSRLTILKKFTGPARGGMKEKLSGKYKSIIAQIGGGNYDPARDPVAGDDK